MTASPHRVVGMALVSLPVLVLDEDCARHLRVDVVVNGGDSRGDGGPKSEPEKVVRAGEPGEHGPPRLSLSLSWAGGGGGVSLSERNCSWLAARTSCTLAAQSSRSYSLCSSSLNVNG